MLCQTKQSITLGYCFCTYFAGKVVKTSKKICVNLLQALDSTDLDIVYEATLE